MKLLFDQNLSPKLGEYFTEYFDDCKHVQMIGLGESADSEVWEFAKSNGYTIVSKDSDFNNLVTYFGFPPKVIWLRRGNCSTKTIIEMIFSYKSNFSFLLSHRR